MPAFGTWVRERRKALRRTQTECARRAGIAVQQWSRMERQVEQPQVHTVEIVARGLEIPVAEVYGAIGFIVPGASDYAEAVCDRLAPILDQVPHGRREAFAAALEMAAKSLVAMAAPSDKIFALV